MKQNDPPFVWVLKIKEYFTAPVKNCGTKILFSLSWTNFKGQNCGDLLDKVLVSYCPYQLFTTEMFCPLYPTRQNYLKIIKSCQQNFFWCLLISWSKYTTQFCDLLMFTVEGGCLARTAVSCTLTHVCCKYSKHFALNVLCH